MKYKVFKDGRIVEDRALGICPNSVCAMYTFIRRHWLQYLFEIQTINIKTLVIK